MRSRLTPAAGLAVSLAVPVALAAPAGAAADDEALPTSVSVKDFRDDVVKYDGRGYRRYSHGLDVYAVKAAVTDGVLRLVLKVDDLKPQHTREIVDEYGWHSIASMLAVIVKVDGTKHYVSYGSFGEPDADDFPSCRGDGSDEQGATLAEQAADYDADTVTFTLPVECLPEEHTTAKVSGYTFWHNSKGVILRDQVGRTRTSTYLKWSPAFSYAPAAEPA